MSLCAVSTFTCARPGEAIAKVAASIRQKRIPQLFRKHTPPLGWILIVGLLRAENREVQAERTTAPLASRSRFLIEHRALAVSRSRTACGKMPQIETLSFHQTIKERAEHE
jgi:hypothetical protein